jgi:hypothetical protein
VNPIVSWQTRLHDQVLTSAALNACVRRTWVSVIAVGIIGADGNAQAAIFNAGVATSERDAAGVLAGQARAVLTGLHAVTEHSVVAIDIGIAAEVRARIGRFVTFHAPATEDRRTARTDRVVAGFQTVAEKPVIAVGIDQTRRFRYRRRKEVATG